MFTLGALRANPRGLDQRAATRCALVLGELGQRQLDVAADQLRFNAAVELARGLSGDRAQLMLFRARVVLLQELLVGTTRAWCRTPGTGEAAIGETRSTCAAWVPSGRFFPLVREK